jgi:two-component system, OmpR family, sensor kinase
MPSDRRRSSVYVIAAFGLVAALLALTNGVTLYEVRQAQRRSRGIMQNATASIRLVGRMDHDLARQRQLVEAHIFQKEAVAMAQVEARLRAVHADFEDAARQYASHVDFRGEASAWRQLEEDLAVIESPVADVLALSRQDRDEEARAGMMALETRFGIIDGDMAILVRINQDAADAAAARVAALQRTTTVLLLVLAALGVALILIVGTLTSRFVRQAEEEARHHAAALEARNRELDEFAGRVAHDLRGPLSAISMAGTILARPEADVAGTVAVLKRGVQRMETLIRDLLALSRVQADAHDGHGDPALVASQVSEELAPRLRAEQATLRIEVEPALVRCAEGLLRQVLVNLADNAIKYRREEAPPEIEILGRAVGNRYELRVTDNGIGMSSDESRHAFEPFYRAPGAREAPGTGLGLSIVKRVVEASAGTVSVDSRPGHGTTFVIQLALSK